MNKNIIVLSVLFLMMIAPVSAVVYPQYDQFDRPDNASLGGQWSPDNSGLAIINGKLSNNNSAPASEFFSLTNATDHSYATFKINSTNYQQEFLFRSDDSISNARGYYLRYRFGAFSFVSQASSPNWIDVYNLTNNTEYHIELKNINYTTGTYDIWVDNVQRYVGAGMSQGALNTDDILVSWSSGQLATLDDLAFGTEGDTFPSTCVEDWVCSGYGTPTCLINDTNTASCNAVTDNNACGTSYTGDFSEFANQTGVCDYCTPNPAPTCAVEDTSQCALTNFTANVTCIAGLDNNGCFATTGLPSDELDLDSLYPPYSCSEFTNEQFNDAQGLMIALLPLLILLGLISTVPQVRNAVAGQLNNSGTARIIVGAVSLILVLVLIGLLV